MLTEDLFIDAPDDDWPLTLNPCPACGGRHDLFPPTGADRKRGIIELDCPETKTPVGFRLNKDGKWVPSHWWTAERIRTG